MNVDNNTFHVHPYHKAILLYKNSCLLLSSVHRKKSCTQFLAVNCCLINVGMTEVTYFIIDHVSKCHQDGIVATLCYKISCCVNMSTEDDKDIYEYFCVYLNWYHFEFNCIVASVLTYKAKLYIKMDVTCMPVSRIEFVRESSVHWPIIGLGTHT